MSQKKIFILSFFLFLILIFLQLVGIFKLFLVPILWAAILALVFYPLYKQCFRLMRGKKNIAAALASLIVAVLTAGPMIFFSGTLVKEILQFYAEIGMWIAQGKHEVLWNRVLDSPLKILWDKIVEKTEVLNIQLMPLAGKTAQTMSKAIVDQIQHGATNFLIFILNYVITIIILFFFFRDGASLGQGIKDLFPMTRENKETIFERLSTTVSAVVRGLVLTGVAQSLLAGLAFWVLGVPYPVFLALLIAFLALVPVGGAFFIWLPSALYLGLSGHWGKALILFIWGTLIVSTIDNLLRPLLIGEKTKIPTLFLFLAILGGLAFYGLIGIFLGPLMLALFLTLIEIYRKEYPQVESAS